MPFSIDNDRALPTDITPRTPVYRRQGIIAALIARLVARATTRRMMRRLARPKGYRAQEVPDYLREDIGLPPLPPRPPDRWEIK